MLVNLMISAKFHASVTDINRYVVFAPDVFYLRLIPNDSSQYPCMWGFHHVLCGHNLHNSY